MEKKDTAPEHSSSAAATAPPTAGGVGGGAQTGEKRKSIVSATSSDSNHPQRRKGSLISEDSFHIENSIPAMASSGDEDKIGIDNLSVRVECAVCNVRLGPQAMTMHLQGKPHLKKVEHALMEESKFNWCPICCVQLSSLKQAFSHCMSKQHCEKLLKQQGVDFGPKRKQPKPNNMNAGLPMGHQMAKQQMQHMGAMGQPPIAAGVPPNSLFNNRNIKVNKKIPGKQGQQQQDFKCEYCQVFLNSQKQLEQHNSSPKHITTKNSINKQMGSTVSPAYTPLPAQFGTPAQGIHSSMTAVKPRFDKSARHNIGFKPRTTSPAIGPRPPNHLQTHQQPISDDPF